MQHLYILYYDCAIILGLREPQKVSSKHRIKVRKLSHKRLKLQKAFDRSKDNQRVAQICMWPSNAALRACRHSVLATFYAQLPWWHFSCTQVTLIRNAAFSMKLRQLEICPNRTTYILPSKCDLQLLFYFFENACSEWFVAGYVVCEFSSTSVE